MKLFLKYHFSLISLILYLTISLINSSLITAYPIASHIVAPVWLHSKFSNNIYNRKKRMYRKNYDTPSLCCKSVMGVV